MSPARRERLALGAVAAALAICLSYTGQRLWQAWSSPDDSGLVLATASIPYFWRCGASLLQGGVVGLLVAALAPSPGAWLDRCRPLAWALVPACALALLLVP